MTDLLSMPLIMVFCIGTGDRHNKMNKIKCDNRQFNEIHSSIAGEDVKHWMITITPRTHINTTKILDEDIEVALAKLLEWQECSVYYSEAYTTVEYSVPVVSIVVVPHNKATDVKMTLNEYNDIAEMQQILNEELTTGYTLISYYTNGENVIDDINYFSRVKCRLGLYE